MTNMASNDWVSNALFAQDYSLDLDGSNDYVSIANPSTDLSGNLTISMWFLSSVSSWADTLISKDYDGEFGSQPGLKHGHGIRNLYLNDEIYSTYEGKYFNDQRKGYGVYENIMKGWKYVGEYKDGKRIGEGTMTWDNGDKFVGEWKKGEPWNIEYFDKKGELIWEIYREGEFPSNSYLKVYGRNGEIIDNSL